MLLEIDARGDVCPVPVIKTRNALKSMVEPGEVRVLVDNDIAVQNLIKMSKQLGLPVETEEIEKNYYSVTIIKNQNFAQRTHENSHEIPPQKLPQTTSQISNETVLLISSETLGEGDEKLGKLLMKGYLYSLSQEENPAKTLIFINGGAKITANQHSPSLVDLQVLLQKGSKILTCGTCVDFYQLELQLGEIVNMYDISQALKQAEKVIHL